VYSYPHDKIFPFNFTHSLDIVKLAQRCKWDENVKRYICYYNCRKRGLSRGRISQGEEISYTRSTGGYK